MTLPTLTSNDKARAFEWLRSQIDTHELAGIALQAWAELAAERYLFRDDWRATALLPVVIESTPTTGSNAVRKALALKLALAYERARGLAPEALLQTTDLTAEGWRLWGAVADVALSHPPAAAEPATDTYVQQVPDKCDRIVWRGRYYTLELLAATPKEPKP